MNISSHFFQTAKQYPQHLAMVAAKEQYNFEAFAKMVEQTAVGLQQMGIRKGDKIMLLIPFSPALYVHILAVFSLGARVVLVDQIKPKSRVKYAFYKAECKYILTLPILKTLKYFFFDRSLWPKIKVAKRAKGYVKVVDLEADETALITFTSGTTSHPKAADRTHRFLNIQLQTIAEELGLATGKAHLTSLPVVLMCNLAFGVTSIIPPKYTNGKAWKQILEIIQPDILSASPYHMSEFFKKINTKQVEACFIGGATILPHYYEKLKKSIALEKVQFVYGSTEAEPMALCKAVDYEHFNKKEQGIFVGFKHENIELIINKQGAQGIQLCEVGEIGEILVSGPHVLDNYFKDEAAFRQNKILENGVLWHRTGDAGYLKSGALFYLGRLKYCQTWKGKFFCPTLVEKELSVKYGYNGTMLCIKNEMHLFVEGEKESKTSIELSIMPDKIQYLEKLPRDKRHESRINYTELLKNKDAI